MELYCFRHGRTLGQGGLGKAEHFWNAVDLLWNYEGSTKKFDRTPWADIMVDRYCAHRYLGVAGCASSGKTETFAIISIVEFLCAPEETMVLVTSTSLKDARKRIWGSIVEYWLALDQECLPGKLVDSLGMIRGPVSDKTGISLIAAADSKAKDAVSKLIGFKKDRVILIADELPELSQAILEAAFSNLSANKGFKLAGLGNPDSYYDPFGRLCTPKDGWESVTPDDDEWEGEKAHVIRFDGHKSENFLTGRQVIPWMRSREDILELQRTLGENSQEYWRMVRGFWSPTGREACIYSESEVVLSRAHRQVTWASPPRRLVALDPAFTSGGDKPTAVTGLLGEEATTRKTVLFLEAFEDFVIDITRKDEPPSYQVVRQFRAMCEKKGVPPEDAVYDCTGSGTSFGHIVEMQWSPKVGKITFAGRATSKRISASDPTPGHERYMNRMSEIWFAGKSILADGLLAGLKPDLVAEMCLRTYSTTKGSSGVKIAVEAKRDLKSRSGRSPDLSDAFFILLDYARERFGFGLGGRAPAQTGSRGHGPLVPGGNTKSPWKQLAKRYVDAALAGRRL